MNFGRCLRLDDPSTVQRQGSSIFENFTAGFA
jgi:hypothetical protein